MAGEESGRRMTFIDEIGDERLVELYRYWLVKKGERELPGRCDIDPVEIPDLLPYLLLTEIVDGGRRLRYRLAGTEVERFFGRPMTGRFVDELLKQHYRAYLEDLYAEMIRRRSPVYSESAYKHRDNPLRTRRLMLPLSTQGREIDMALCGQVFWHDSSLGEATVYLVQSEFDALDQATER